MGTWTVSRDGGCNFKEEDQEKPHGMITCKHRHKGEVMRMSRVDIPGRGNIMCKGAEVNGL